ncbi:MAG: type II secretion system F family protein [Thermoguttaceae bacterium]
MNAISLDDLIALNDEIAALTRAGAPLESGLAELGADMPGRLGQLAAALAEKTSRGQSLAEAVLENAGQLPPTYHAVIEAGVRAGRLPAALESVAASARRQADTQRAASIAILYPLMVVLVAWLGLIFFTLAIAPQLDQMFVAFDIPGRHFFEVLKQTLWYWGPVAPVVALLGVVAWWYGCATGRSGGMILGWLPWMGRLLRATRDATFLEVLSLLVENKTPLPEAMVLAGDASGDRRMQETVRRVAAMLQNGQTPPIDDASLPPLIRRVLLAAGRGDVLLLSLQHMVASCHREARHQAEMMRLLLPVVLTVALGGCVTLLYALALFVPYKIMLQSLSG